MCEEVCDPASPDSPAVRDTPEEELELAALGGRGGRFNVVCVHESVIPEGDEGGASATIPLSVGSKESQHLHLGLKLINLNIVYAHLYPKLE